MSAILPLIIFVIQFGALCGVWWFTTDHNKRDFIFWLIGAMLAAQNGRFFGSVLFVQLRYLFIPMMILAILFRQQFLRGNMGGNAWRLILLFLLIFVASAWSDHPREFFSLKLRRTVYGVLMVVMAGTFRDERDLRKLLWAILPNIILLAVGLQLGERNTIGDDQRLEVNEFNANGVGVFAGYLLFSSVAQFIFLKHHVIVKILLVLAGLSGLVTLLGTGSRTAFASCTGASLVILMVVLTNRKRIITTAIPLAVGLVACGWKVWNTLSYSVAQRLLLLASGGYSGREDVWAEGFRWLFQKKLWYGMGGIVQGFFVQRIEFLQTNEMHWGSTLNIYFDAILETGVFGLALWLSILVSFFTAAYSLWRREHNPWRYFPIALAMFGLLQGVGESMSYRAEHPAGMFLMIGLTVLSARRFQWRQQPIQPFPYQNV